MKSKHWNNRLTIAVPLLFSLLFWGGHYLLTLSSETMLQREQWAASRAEAALNRELLRIVTDLHAGKPKYIYSQYAAIQHERLDVEALPEPPPLPELMGDIDASELKRLSGETPHFPKAARPDKLQADCRATLVIGEDGRVQSAQVDVCPEVFHDGLEATLLTWAYAPITRDGAALSPTVQIPIRFRFSETASRIHPAPARLSAAPGSREARIADIYKDRLLAVAKLADPETTMPTLVQSEDAAALLVPTRDNEQRWILPWNRLASLVEARSGVRITLDEAESSGRQLTISATISGPPIWLHRDILTSDISGSSPLASWPRVSERWPMPPSVNGVVLSLMLVLSLYWLIREGVERSLVGARERAAVEAREGLLQRISHELRTPASAVLSMAGVLEGGSQGMSGAEREQFTGLLREEAGRLAGGLDRLLRAARGEVNQPLDTTTLDLAEWADGVARRWQASLPGLTLEAAGPLMVVADPERLDEAIDALLDNARRYGGERVSLRLRTVGHELRVTVEDGGPGVPSAEQAAIFDKLVRGSEQQEGGFGLGLWAAREVAQAHGGTLTLEGGSCFVLTLPGVR